MVLLEITLRICVKNVMQLVLLALSQPQRALVVVKLPLYHFFISRAVYLNVRLTSRYKLAIFVSSVIFRARPVQGYPLNVCLVHST